MTDVLGAVAASWGVLMAISPILQIRRMLDRRSSTDIPRPHPVIRRMDAGDATFGLRHLSHTENP